jgi:hypothetical protein
MRARHVQSVAAAWPKRAELHFDSLADLAHMLPLLRIMSRIALCLMGASGACVASGENQLMQASYRLEIRGGWDIRRNSWASMFGVTTYPGLQLSTAR